MDESERNLLPETISRFCEDNFSIELTTSLTKCCPSVSIIAIISFVAFIQPSFIALDKPKRSNLFINLILFSSREISLTTSEVPSLELSSITIISNL